MSLVLLCDGICYFCTRPPAKVRFHPPLIGPPLCQAEGEAMARELRKDAIPAAEFARQQGWDKLDAEILGDEPSNCV